MITTAWLPGRLRSGEYRVACSLAASGRDVAHECSTTGLSGLDLTVCGSGALRAATRNIAQKAGTDVWPSCESAHFAVIMYDSRTGCRRAIARVRRSQPTRYMRRLLLTSMLTVPYAFTSVPNKDLSGRPIERDSVNPLVLFDRTPHRRPASSARVHTLLGLAHLRSSDRNFVAQANSRTRPRFLRITICSRRNSTTASNACCGAVRHGRDDDTGQLSAGCSILHRRQQERSCQGLTSSYAVYGQVVKG